MSQSNQNDRVLVRDVSGHEISDQRVFHGLSEAIMRLQDPSRRDQRKLSPFSLDIGDTYTDWCYAASAQDVMFRAFEMLCTAYTVQYGGDGLVAAYRALVESQRE